MRILVTDRHDILGVPPVGRVALAHILLDPPPERYAFAIKAAMRFLEISDVCYGFPTHLKPFSKRALRQDMLHGVCHARKALGIGERKKRYCATTGAQEPC